VFVVFVVVVGLTTANQMNASTPCLY